MGGLNALPLYSLEFMKYIDIVLNVLQCNTGGNRLPYHKLKLHGEISDLSMKS